MYNYNTCKLSPCFSAGFCYCREWWSPSLTAGFLLVESSLLWSVFCYAQRQTLKALLLYKGWMFDPRGCVTQNSVMIACD